MVIFHTCRPLDAPQRLTLGSSGQPGSAAALMCRLMLLIVVSAFVVAGVSGANGSAGSVQVHWVIRDLGSLGGTGTEARAINERGQVVGSSHEATGPMLAFLWQKGKMTSLGSMPALGCGSDVPFTSYAVAINQRGQVVGQAYCNTLNVSFSFLWQSGKMIDLGSKGVDNNSTSGPALNDRGQVVGMNSKLHAFLWQNGMMTDLGILPGRPYSEAVAINERGQVIGNSYATKDEYGSVSGSRAFVWWKGKITAIGSPAVKETYAAAINERGQVVGTSGGHGFLWRNGKMTSLGTLPGRPYSDAVAINERGQVVGRSYALTGSDLPTRTHSFV